MNAIPSTNAERAGKWFGRARRAFGRNEARASGWLARRGLPASMARVLLWIAKLAILGVLLYSVFWLTAFLVFGVVVIGLLAANGPREEKQPELRDGHSGIGVYDKDDWRIDIGDPNEP